MEELRTLVWKHHKLLVTVFNHIFNLTFIFCLTLLLQKLDDLQLSSIYFLILDFQHPNLDVLQQLLLH
jgi:hypothetical protein